MKRPLDGIVVLDLSRLLPGPFLTMILSDLGAEVIKVEDPRIGDYMRQFPPAKAGMNGGFLAINRDKRSVALDLKSDAGRDAFLRMAERADVVVESFRPGVMEKLGVGYDPLRQRRSDIILCSISGYGKDGPYQKRAGHDLNYIALAGVLAMGGPRGGAPTLPGVQIADLAGGALWGVSGVLGALVGRERSGEGAHLDISMTEGAMALLATHFGLIDCGGVPETRGTYMLNGGLAAYGVYRTKDDKYFSVGSLEPKFYFALNAALGRKGDIGELAAPPDKQDAIRAEIQEIFLTRTRDEWEEVFRDADCCAEPVLELEEIADHPLHREREVFFTIDSEEAGAVRQMRTPIGNPRGERIAPTLGQHTAEVLGEFGFSEVEIAELQKPPS